MSCSGLLRMRNVSDRVVENQNPHFMFSNVFRKSCRLWGNVEKYRTAGQATDDNMGHAHCVLNTEGYKHRLTLSNTYCFSTARMFAQTRLNITLYVHCLPFFFIYLYKFTSQWMKQCISGPQFIYSVIIPKPNVYDKCETETTRGPVQRYPKTAVTCIWFRKLHELDRPTSVLRVNLTSFMLLYIQPCLFHVWI